MTLATVTVYSGGWFWVATLFAAAAAQAVARVRSARGRIAGFLLVQLGLLAVALRLPPAAIVFWMALAGLTYLLSTASAPRRAPARVAAVWIFWTAILIVFRQHVFAAGRWSGALPLFAVGHSYFAVRAISFASDVRSGKAGRPSFPLFLGNVLFAPAFVAGPIDRYARFAADWSEQRGLSAATGLAVVERMAVGGVKKFFLVKLLEPWVLSPASLANMQAVSLPVFLKAFYAYAFFLLVDFSAYTDFAIAAGLLFGVRLPENFNFPYAARNIIDFWNRWHMSFSAWFRDYLFRPITRRLFRRSALGARPLLVGTLAYLATMAYCGFWHGLGLNFLAWGLYHGAGLSVCKAFDRWTRARPTAPLTRFLERPAGRAASTVATFHFVAVGWLLFQYPLPALARLFSLLGNAS
jgi:D-alanyl-lipoteichoic acid acyltransferase DltB (MBOAT superfamily)